MRGRHWGTILVWAGLALVALWVIARARYSADLSAFLPRAPTAEQRLLVEQLRQGVASRLIVAAIEGADAPARARLSADLTRRLRANAEFLGVENGDAASAQRDEAFLFAHRYLLSSTVTPERFSVAGLKAAIGNTIDLLASPAGMLAKSLVPSDPTGEMMTLLDQLSRNQPPRTQDGVWVSKDGTRALLLVHTRAAGSDTDGQQHAVEAIQAAFRATLADQRAALADQRAAPADQRAALAEQQTAPTGFRPALIGKAATARLVMSGPGVFAVRARATIKSEVTRLSIISSVLIVTLLLLVYRSVPALLLGLVPVVSGALAGIAAVALGFGVVQGVTLGFGVTLIGEGVDYSIYLFIQSQARTGADAASDDDWRRSVWPTIRLGMLTSVCGFAVLLVSSFPGLAQLGLYSLSGVLAAGFVTRFVLPELLPRGFRIRDLTMLGRAAARVLQKASAGRAVIAVIAIGAAVVVSLYHQRFWSHDLSVLSPVPLAAQRLDAELRADLGAPDVRYLVVVSAPDEQSALEGAAHVGTELDGLVARHVIAGYQSPALYLPSPALQRQRRASLPPPAVLNARLEQALSGLPLRADRLAPFLHDVEVARTAPLLTRSSLDGTSFASVVNALLVRETDGWHALLPLTAPVANGHSVDIDLARVRQAVSVKPPDGVTVLNLKDQVDALYATYLAGAVRLSLAGFGAIVVLLLIALRRPGRVLRVVLPLALAVLTVAAGLRLFGAPLTLLHVVGMLLIIAVGSNYALFFDKRFAGGATGAPAGPGHAAAAASDLTLASLLVANCATVVAFGVLALSSVPVLHDLGETVAPGALLALVYAALLAREPAR
ncbi:MAG TPA: MMPL family transporter [Steroidobacteraceae bacterium]|nr:MMPL family transporter [Steroidobacteraceae bacterium]